MPIAPKKKLPVDLSDLRHIAVGGGGAAGVAPIGGIMCLHDYPPGFPAGVAQKAGYSAGMKPAEPPSQLRKKNWIILSLLLALMVLLYGMSFVKFGMAVKAQPGVEMKQE